MPPTLPETLFQALIESAPDAMVIVSADGNIVRVNSQTEHLFGFQRDEMLGGPVELLLPEALHSMHRRHRAGYAAEPHTRPMGIGLNLAARRKDGSVFPVEISLSPLRTDDGLLVTAVIRDVTYRRRAAEELERQVQQRTAHLNTLLKFSEELLGARSLDAVLQQALKHALALAPDAQLGAIYLANDGDLALRASTGFQTLPSLRLSMTTGIVGRAFSEQRAQETHSTAEFEVLLHDAPDDRRQLLRALGSSVLPSGMLAIPLIVRQQSIGVLVIFRVVGDGPFAAARTTLEGLANLAAAAISEDQRASEAAALSHQLKHLEAQQRSMTERLSTAEAAMLQAARLAAVGELAASIAHEINNPLYAVRNALYLLESDLPETLRESLYMGIARKELTRIAGIIERMRDFYRPARREMHQHDLNKLLEETLALTNFNIQHTAIQVIFTPETTLPLVVCDADQMRQVFLNMILNAIDAMPQGGTLTVRTSAGTTSAVVEIEDTGIGIPESVRSRLFEPFFTNKSKGTGLGLSISAHIVTQHNGYIQVESEESIGTTFFIRVPYQQDE